MLLLRELIQGNYSQAAACVLPVVAVTLAACWVAVRWAIDQFNRESVLFRESERLDLGLWLKHLIQDRPATPTVAMGVTCGVMILVLRFFASLATPLPTTTNGLLVVQVASMIAIVAMPGLLMAVVLTRSPRRSLLLNRPRLGALTVAGLLAVTLHPVVIAFHRQLAELYHFDQRALAGFADLLEGIQPWQALAVFALLPAVCEELVFRGFILTGLRQSGSLWRAIALSAVFFGLAHLTAQQSIGAVVLGLVLGVIAVRTGSLWPGVLFHLIHNALTIGLVELAAHPATQWLFQRGEELPIYDAWIVAAGNLCSLCLL
jgi:sodium transport system permease protein